MQNNIAVMNALKRQMNQFISKMAIPTYNKLSQYNYHDTLTALVRYIFTVQHREAFEERQERI